MMQSALVVSHADADGHLIAEQTRRNLALVPSFNVEVEVDPDLTKDHSVWKKLPKIKGIESADLIFFVDLMFGPETFVEESKALVNFVSSFSNKCFFLIDHHPIPLRRLEAAENLRVKYRPEVFECAIGPRSGMMVVAAICEKQGSMVAEIKTPYHEILAEGIRRAAALGGELPGEKLLTLLRFDRWDDLAELGRDDPTYHRLPRGRRPAGQTVSSVLRTLDSTATQLLTSGKSSGSHKTQHGSGMVSMTYDFEGSDGNIGRERYRQELTEAQLADSRPHREDLEVIVTLLEIAALSLTTEADATFGVDQLVDEARRLGGNEIAIEERDVKIVLDKAKFVEKVSGGFRLR